MFGDVAIYVAPGSADHRAHPELFRSGVVAGAPPDAFSDDGQLWGNPVYDWPALRRRSTGGGSSGCGGRCRCSIWPGSTTSAGSCRTGPCLPGRARRGPGGGSAGPGGRCSTRLRGRWGTLALVAEDLGVITPAVTALRESLGFPGMVVLQFGFDPRAPGSVHRFENHVEDRVVYTGTHDHDTARGWYSGLPADVRSFVDATFARYGVVERGSRGGA